VRNTSWSQPTSWEEVKCRAVGRYKYNAIRRFNAQLRRRETCHQLRPRDWWAS
jgi:hypothetical protein